jgi:hypothetical protein
VYGVWRNIAGGETLAVIKIISVGCVWFAAGVCRFEREKLLWERAILTVLSSDGGSGVELVGPVGSTKGNTKRTSRRSPPAC